MQMTITKASTPASLTPLSHLSVYETSLACRKMIKDGIPKSVVAAYMLDECGSGSLSLDYLEVRYGKMYGPRRKS